VADEVEGAVDELADEPVDALDADVAPDAAAPCDSML